MNTVYVLTALAHKLGTPRQGDLVFTRCLGRAEIDALLCDTANAPGAWRLKGVGTSLEASWIAADEAVEIREDKGQGTMLFVDVATAGAGMDGIYNAAREITEEALFSEAIRLAKKDLESEVREFADEAVRRAKRVGGRRNEVARRQVFDFYAALASASDKPSYALTRLGLWPVAGSIDEASRYLSQAGLMVEKLLLPPATSQAPGVRAAALMLERESDGQRAALERLLRQAGAMPRLDVLAQAAQDEKLWLGNLRPAFLSNKLVGIELTQWRQANGGILKWSGLSQPIEDELPHFVIDRANPKCRLEVRWRVAPDHLPKGAVTFEVRVFAGDDVLASGQFEHSGKSELKAVFTPEDFDELEESARLEACVEVSVSGQNDIPAQRTDDFVVLFGETIATDRVSIGEVYRAVADGVVQATSREGVEEFVVQRQQGAQGQADKHGFLAFRIGASRKGFRVERPELLAAIEKDWLQQGSPVGRWRVRCRPDGSWSGDIQFESMMGDQSPKPEWTRLAEAARKFRDDCQKAGGVLSRFYLHGHSSAEVVGDYLNTWQAVLEKGPSVLALANTIEVRTLGERTLGLIVLPFHPMRVAWLYWFSVNVPFWRQAKLRGRLFVGV